MQQWKVNNIETLVLNTIGILAEFRCWQKDPGKHDMDLWQLAELWPCNASKMPNELRDAIRHAMSETNKVIHLVDLGHTPEVAKTPFGNMYLAWLQVAEQCREHADGALYYGHYMACAIHVMYP